MTITITILPLIPVPDRPNQFRATVKVGEVETALSATHSKNDALNGAISYILEERNRGTQSKFSLFQESFK
jgi:hypothetical protein